MEGALGSAAVEPAAGVGGEPKVEASELSVPGAAGVAAGGAECASSGTAEEAACGTESPKDGTAFAFPIAPSLLTEVAAG